MIYMQTVRQLSKIFRPTNYNLSLDLSKSHERKFSGLIDISGILLQPGEITLHSKDLTIESVLVNGKSAEFSHGEFDELSITHKNPGVGEFIVTISFSGEITDAMHGIYPCYFEHEGKRKELIATQFESHHAREAFPCVDEPAAKATFDVTLTTQTDITVLGNMPVRSERIEDDLLVTTFETTPKMSSYLLAWVVGEMHKKTATTKSGVEVNAWAAMHQDPSTLDFGLDIATRTIDFFDEYFGVKYPLPKCDNVALPDFSSGAMENWGLVTYRENCLLADPKLSSVSAKRLVATVITHELSHQWFGNLVTMQWWNDLWLNESFANMMEYVAVDALEPDWRIWEEFASYEVTSALRRDSLDGVQSVQTEVNHPDEISALFDPSIVYAKGGRLLRMVRQLVGEKAFRTGLKSYFEKYAYQNTVGDDLWRELEASSGKPIVKIMNAWISQPGLPIVSIETDESTAKLSQKRFFIGENSGSDSVWLIPLFSNQAKFDEIFDENEKTFETSGDIQLNQGLAGHFVTHYDQSSLEKLLEKSANDNLETLDKICLLQDAPLLTRAGINSSATLLPLSLAFSHETNQKVFDMAAMNLGELRKFVEDNEVAKQKLKQISVEFAKKSFEELGWDEKPGELDDDKERRSTAIGLMIYGENKSALKEAKKRFDENSLENLSAELRSNIITAVVRHYETSELVKNLLEAYHKTPSGDLQIDISIGLTSTKNPATTKKILEEIKSGETVRKQDASRWFAYLIRTKESRAITWQWLKDNWSWVKNAFGGDKSYDTFIRYAGMALLTREELDDFTAYFTPMMSEPALKRTIHLAIRETSARVELIESDKEAVIKSILDQ